MSNHDEYTIKLLDKELKLGFQPYKFQISLAKNSCLNLNNIICVRTGSGKTLISALIARYWYEKFLSENELENFKIVFIVPTRNLVQQQSKVFEKAFRKDEIIEITEKHDSGKIHDYFSSKKIFFLTPQKLINTLNETDLSIDRISILFFDECHHTNDSHPYNEIMKFYFKHSGEKKPLIVGLTASLGTGKSNALKHLITLCANMNCKSISSVSREDQVNLDTSIPSPLNDIIRPVELNKEILSIRSKIESITRELAEKVRIVRSNIRLGHSEFDQFIHDASHHASIQKNQELLIVLKYLYELNLFYQRCEDFPLDYCLEKLKNFVQETKVEDPTKIKILCDSLILDFISSLTVKSNFFNPKLFSLLKTVLEYHKKSSRGLILVRTRNHTKALSEYLNKRPEMKENKILSGILVGLGCVDGISMNENQQRETINKFLNGDFNLLVATDIAQEGLDVPACNYVIRYEFVSNEIGTVQSRGRSRAENGQCVLITTSGCLNERREYENRQREVFMKEAIENFKLMEKSKFEEEFNAFLKLKYFQIKKEESSSSAEQTRALMNPISVNVHCRDCSKFLFNGSKLRYREPSYLSVCKTFQSDLVNLDFDKKKFFCSTKSCGKELGRLIEIRNSSPLFMIDIKGVMFCFPGNKMKPFSKWSGISSIVQIEMF